jgi:hypothetical protein
MGTQNVALLNPISSEHGLGMVLRKESFLKGINQTTVAADARGLQKPSMFTNKSAHSAPTSNGASIQSRKTVHFWTI